MVRDQKASALFAAAVVVGALSCLAALSCSDETSATFARGPDSGAGAPSSSGGSASGGASSNGGASGSGAGGAMTGGVANGGTTSGSGGSGGATSTGGTGGAPSSSIDMFVLFDDTLSMTCLVANSVMRWQVAVDGFRDFLRTPAASGVGVGLVLWGSGPSSSCDPSDYATPLVEIAELPDNFTTLSDALASVNPQAQTVPGPALEGGIQHARAWAQAHPERTTVVVMLADGVLASFCQTIDAVAAATAGKSANIATYVIGVIDRVGANCSMDPSPPDPIDFHSIAIAGGTSAAIIVDAARTGQQGVADAFAQIVTRGGT